jgi:hypothetical protein
MNTRHHAQLVARRDNLLVEAARFEWVARLRARRNQPLGCAPAFGAKALLAAFEVQDEIRAEGGK